MADDDTTNTTEATAAVKESTEAVKEAEVAQKALADATGITNAAVNQSKDAFSFFNNVADLSSKVINDLSKKFAELQVSMENNTELTDSQADAFMKAGFAAINARESFTNLSNVDTTSLNTFSNQFKTLGNIIRDSPLENGLKATLSVMRSMGAGTAAMNGASEAAKQGKEALSGYVQNLMTSADNSLRLKNAFAQLSASTGNLGNVFGGAGEDLSKFNKLVGEQQSMITASAGATNITADVVEEYWAKLGKIPGALDAVVQSSARGNESVSALTAAIQVAHGTGIKYTDVIEDMHAAFRDYGVGAEDALKFTVRMSEISKKHGIELEDVRSALRGTATDFKMFGNASEGAARLMNQYVGSLKDTGISGAVAVDIVKGMTTHLKELTIAQRGFLSAQTGGPGGLLGSIQIEKELKEGKLDKVMDRVRQTMSKQFGKIMTLDDVKTQGDAAQLVRQREMLKGGALGGIVKSDEEANRVLQAFKEVNSGAKPASELGENVVQQAMDKGKQVEDQSTTLISKTNSILEGIRGDLNTMSGRFVGRLATAEGQPVGENGAQDPLTEYRQRLRDSKADMGRLEVGRNNKDTTNFEKANALKNVRHLANTPGDIKSYVPKIQEILNGGAIDAPETKGFDVNRVPKPTPIPLEGASHDMQQTALKRTMNNISNRNAPMSSKDLGGDAVKAFNLDSKSKSKEGGQDTRPAGISGIELTGKMTVEGVCLVCKTKMEENRSGTAANVAVNIKQ